MTWIGIGLLIPTAIPLGLILGLLLIGFGVIWPITAVKDGIRRRSQRKSFQKLDRLSAEGVDGEPVNAELKNLERLQPGMYALAIERFLDPRFRYRYAFISDVGDLVVDQVALRADDPLAPLAWYRGLCKRYDVNRMHAGFLIRVREKLEEGELERLWKRALASQDLWALPPELEVNESHS